MIYKCSKIWCKMNRDIANLIRDSAMNRNVAGGYKVFLFDATGVYLARDAAMLWGNLRIVSIEYWEAVE